MTTEVHEVTEHRIVRHYRAATRGEVEQAYQAEALQAARGGYVAVAHNWSHNPQGFLLAVTYGQVAQPAPTGEPATEPEPALARDETSLETATLAARPAAPPPIVVTGDPQPVTVAEPETIAIARAEAEDQFAPTDDAATDHFASAADLYSEPAPETAMPADPPAARYAPPPEMYALPDDMYVPVVEQPNEPAEAEAVTPEPAETTFVDAALPAQAAFDDSEAWFEGSAAFEDSAALENSAAVQDGSPVDIYAVAQAATQAPGAEADKSTDATGWRPQDETAAALGAVTTGADLFEAEAVIESDVVWELAPEDSPAEDVPAEDGAAVVDEHAAEVVAATEDATADDVNELPDEQVLADEAALAAGLARAEELARIEAVTHTTTSSPVPASTPAETLPTAPVSEPAPAPAQPAPAPARPFAAMEQEADSRQVRLTVQTMDLHAGGEPLRIIRSGFPDVPHLPVLERRQWVMENADHVRRSIMLEPRGHRDMYGAILLPPYNDYADMTVLFMHNEGYSTMCGHGVIAITTGLIEEGLFPASEPVTTIRYEVPAGIVAANAATAQLDDGTWAVRGVRFTNVPSYLAAQSLSVRPEGVELHGMAAQYGALGVDLAFGGAYYGIVNAADLGLRVVPEQADALRRAGAAITDVLRRDHTPSHPTDESLSFVYGTIIVDLDPRSSPDGRGAGAHMRNATIFADAELDRSPCGSGTSAILAQLHARGRIRPGQEIVNASITGERFLGRVEAETALGPYRAVSTSIAGTAYVTGYSTFVVDARDPLGDGFLLS